MSLPLNTIFKYATLPDCSGFHNMPSLFSHNDDDQGTAFHILHKQNATKKITYIFMDYLEVMVFFLESKPTKPSTEHD